MTYHKPEVVVLQAAISAIQSGSDDKKENTIDSKPALSSTSAYEADE